jgi:hypothetical protein
VDTAPGRDQEQARSFADAVVATGITAEITPVLRLGNEQGTNLLSAEDRLQCIDPLRIVHLEERRERSC